MGILTKIFKVTPKNEMEGIHLDYNSPLWEIEGETDYPKLFDALSMLIPDKCIFYFEGGSPHKNDKLSDFFSKRAIPEKRHVAISIYWPRPMCYHVPATAENITTLKEISSECAEYELAVHFHIYRDDKVLLEWHDAFSRPMYLSDEFKTEEIRQFAEKLSMKFKKSLTTASSGREGA